LSSLAARVHRLRGLILPLAAAGLVLAVLVPIPPVLMNVLLVGNITLAAVILLTTIHVSSPLEFSVFPSLLLVATLIRLVLNVATTRLILTAGEGGASMEQAHLAAGQVIWAFSHFVTAGSLEVGVIIFAIISVVQFVVVTKGAARISEVAARFVLDAMPGKQMAIDADLGASMIGEGEARRRRDEVARQADFYGAMDGASKFVRGDAVAAVMITFVNVLGGLYVGLVHYGWSPAETLNLFTRLTIGDGLVTQIPALLISISAALIVTRSTSNSNLPEEVVSQLTKRPVTLFITAGFLVALTATALPKAPLLMTAAGCAGLGLALRRRDGSRERAGRAAGAEREERPSPAAEDRKLEPLLKVDPLRIDLGYSLVPLADAERGGDLAGRVAAMRRAIAGELGMLVPSVKIADDMSLEAGRYVISIRGVKVASGTLRVLRLMATGGDDPAGRLEGIESCDPVTAQGGTWITHAQRAQAEAMGYVVRGPVELLVGHLTEVVRVHGGELLSRRQASRLIDGARATAPETADEAVARFGLARLHRLLQGLLAEGVPVRDLETILETVCDLPPEVDDVEQMAAAVRRAMSSTLAQRYCSEDGKLWCVSLNPALAEEIRLSAAGEGLPGGSPASARRISEALAEGLARLTRHGRRPVLLCEASIRGPLRKMIAPVMPQAAVLAYSEVGSAEVNSVGSVGIQ
jgi:flagellar biosynthesis protein FlhA